MGRMKDLDIQRIRALMCSKEALHQAVLLEQQFFFVGMEKDATDFFESVTYPLHKIVAFLDGMEE